MCEKFQNFRIYVRISGPNSNFRTFQDKFQNFRKTPRPGIPHSTKYTLPTLNQVVIGYPDTSDLRHFGPKKLGPKCLNISDLGPKCAMDTSDLGPKCLDTSDLEFLVYFFCYYEHVLVHM